MATSGERTRRDLADDIVGQLVRKNSTAAVLFHHAIAEQLGLGPTDLKCFDLLRERGTLTGSELARITGLTTGAITGVVARLERAGFVRRAADPHDGRKQVLYPAQDRVQDIKAVFDPIRKDMAELLEQFDKSGLAAIAEFLTLGTELVYRHATLLRSGKLTDAGKAVAAQRATRQ